MQHLNQQYFTCETCSCIFMIISHGRDPSAFSDISCPYCEQTVAYRGVIK